MAQNLKTGDMVKIIAGSNKGQKGKIVKMNLKDHKAIIEGINKVERHYAKTAYRTTAKKEIQLGIDLSNLKKEGK